MMSRGFISGMIMVAAFALINSFFVAYAQTQKKATLELLTQEKRTALEKPAIPLLIVKNKRVLQGSIRFSDDKTTVSLPNRPTIELPPTLETLVSQDGQTIVQYGDEHDQSHPSRTNIYWRDGGGKAVNQVTDYYAEKSLVSVSDDGLTAVTGPLFRDRNTIVLSLYSTAGEKLWERVLGKNDRSAILRVTQGGNHVALVTTDKHKWLEGHRLHIMDKQGKSISSIDAFHIIQKVVVVDAGEHLFVQGFNDYGLLKITNGSVLWRKQQKIRMVSPYGAKIDPAGRILFLVLADFRGKLQAAYRWKLVALSTTDGMQQVSAWLPDEHRGTWNRVFEQISSERVQILTTTKRFTFSWQSSEEDK
jgi:hypothetical protein